MQDFDVTIIGAGAAGLMCALTAGKLGRRVLVIEQAAKPAEKIRISGGGRCNFTNIHCAPNRFLSRNPHFCKSALSRYTAQDFIEFFDQNGIKWHEKTLGQLFCDDSAQNIIDLLLKECSECPIPVEIRLQTAVQSLNHDENGFTIVANGTMTSRSLVIATGGPSIPKMGASGFGYDVARQFGLNVIAPRPALVPLTFTDDIQTLTKDLSGVAVDPVLVTAENGTSFREALLFTHRGLSGPAILQISSYWEPGQEITVNLAPDLNLFDRLKTARSEQAKKMLHTVLGDILPARFAVKLSTNLGHPESRLADLSDVVLRQVADSIHNWRLKPNGSEGFRTAEVTLGGVDTDALSAKTFEAKSVPGLYFIGEVVDVTGWLGGYNFQWAWSSGHACGESL